MGKKSRRPKKKASKKVTDDRISLMCGTGMSPELVETLDSIFQRFDLDGDGVLSLEELQSFARECNDGEVFEEEEIDQLREFFETDETGQLTREGFHQMYHTQTMARPLDTWKDLHALGFDDQLQNTRPPTEQPSLSTITADEKGVPERSNPIETKAAAVDGVEAGILGLHVEPNTRAKNEKITAEEGRAATETIIPPPSISQAKAKGKEEDIDLRADVAAFLKDFNYDTDSDMSEPDGLDDIED
uniref:EF-hand domain-containing protein n=1 Tax=Octactis speculum TaxID=3111310 RepID=A0A7S2DM18_9STRA|mmetsp:Transcript_50931/g.69338  ORF Transcript_50931/g.69338 Transcript_50931/m.69338 type:complete len:245 (+) Transcript_50931:77-811(+)